MPLLGGSNESSQRKKAKRAKSMSTRNSQVGRGSLMKEKGKYVSACAGRLGMGNVPLKKGFPPQQVQKGVVSRKGGKNWPRAKGEEHRDRRRGDSGGGVGKANFCIIEIEGPCGAEAYRPIWGGAGKGGTQKKRLANKKGSYLVRSSKVGASNLSNTRKCVYARGMQADPS